MTFEHVPPKRSFNNKRVKIITFDEVLNAIEQSSMPKGRFQQKGRGGYYLCEECNNNTGSWYAEEYNKVSNGILQYLVKIEGTLPSKIRLVSTEPIFVQRYFKQVITMFCDISRNCMNDQKVKDYLLNKESNSFDTDKYRVFVFINNGSAIRHNGVGGIIDLNKNKSVLIAEIIDSPLSYILVINGKDEDLSRFGYEITDWALFNYNDSQPIDITLPIKYISSYVPYQMI